MHQALSKALRMSDLEDGTHVHERSFKPINKWWIGKFRLLGFLEKGPLSVRVIAYCWGSIFCCFQERLQSCRGDQTICFWRARTCTTRKDVAQMSNVSPFTVQKTLHTASYGTGWLTYLDMTHKRNPKSWEIL